MALTSRVLVWFGAMSRQQKWSVIQIAERALLEDGVSIDNEALELIRECVAEFMSSLSCDAITMAAQTGKRRVTGNDMVNSIKAFGFDDYVPSLEVYLHKFHLHSKHCQECSKISPVPHDVLQEEERVGAVDSSAKPAKKTQKKDAPSAESVPSDRADDAAETTTTKKKSSKSAEKAPSSGGKPNSSSRKVPPVHERLQDPEFVASLHERIRVAAGEADPKRVLKLLADELKIPLRDVKGLFDQ